MILMLAPVSMFSQDGKAIFTTTCTACHSIGKGTVVGPDLKDVSKRHSIDWISKWIRGSQAMVDAKDPVAVDLFNKFNMIPMPDQALSDGEIKAVLDYITSESGGGVVADKKADDKKADTAKAAVASDKASTGTSTPASDNKVSVAQSTTAVSNNDNAEDSKSVNPDKFFLILTISFVGFIFLGIVWALSYAINRLSKALAETTKKKD
jgi:cytochrome c551/c552